jgi:hypothetical protein
LLGSQVGDDVADVGEVCIGPGVVAVFFSVLVVPGGADWTCSPAVS